MHSQWLECNLCSEKIHFPKELLFYYDGLLDDRHCQIEEFKYFDIDPINVWCAVCNKPSFAEPEISEETFESRIIELTNMYESMNYRDPEYKTSQMVNLKNYKSFAKNILKNKHRSKCLFCGGYQYQKIDEQKPLVHESCGGKFRIDGMFAGGIFYTNSRYYDLNGNLKAIVRHSRENGVVFELASYEFGS